MSSLGEKRRVKGLVVVREEKYGTEVWSNTSTDALRRSHCLCLNCVKCKPETEEHCEIAQQAYELAVATDIAFMVTRCPVWEPKPGHD